MAARVYYYAEDLTSTTNATTTPQSKVSITFPQVSGKSYAIFWHSNFITSATAQRNFRLQDTTNNITYQLFTITPEDTVDSIVLDDVYAYTASTTGDITFEVQFYITATGNMTAEKTYILVLELSPNDLFSYTSGTTTTTSNVYATLNSVTVGAGDWFIIGSMGVSIGATSIGANPIGMRIFDGTTEFMQRDSLSVNANTDYSPYWAIANVSPTTTTTYDLQHRENAALTLSSRYRTILALKKSDFDETFYNVSEADTTTTLTANQTKLTLTETPTFPVDYLILGFWYTRITSNATGYVKSSMAKDGTSYFTTEPSREAQDVDEDFQNGLMLVENLPTTSTSWTIRFRSNTAGQTTSIGNAAIAVINLGGEGAKGYSFGYIIY